VSTAAQRRVKRRRALPGFPWVGQFATPEEARDYVSRESIQCLICGKHYKALGSHINRIHQFDETSYKQQFGIPYTVGLVSDPTATRHAEALAKHIAPEERIVHVSSARTRLQQNIDSGVQDWRVLVSSVYNQRIQQIKSVNEAPSCSRPCFLCGNSVTVKGARIFCKDEMIRCEGCIAPSSRKPHKMSREDRDKLRQWAANNPEGPRNT
jgi:hypothetical protein